MTDKQRPTVVKVIEAFRSRLSDTARNQITDAQFADLAMMIEEAIAEELGTAADIVEEALKKLRAVTPKPDLGL